MDAATWKLADLENIMKNDMGIRERPDQPVRVSFMVMLKGNVVFSRSYDDKDTKSGGKLANFFETFRDRIILVVEFENHIRISSIFSIPAKYRKTGIF